MEIRVRLEKDEDGVWVVVCPSLPGCISQGKSQAEALKNIKEAIKLHISSLAEDGLPIFESKDVSEALVEVNV
ncbi:MAG: type II toxin-antitoxin system HicB family antitoxin [Candidatus Omnitrophota bacterium]